MGTESLLGSVWHPHLLPLTNRKIDRDLLGPCVGETEFRSMKSQ